MAMTPSVVINRPVRDFLLMDPAGPVQRDMFRRAGNVLFAAQTRCPTHLSTLLGSLHIAPTVVNGSPGYKVGSELEYAIFVDQGTGLAAGHGPYAHMPPPDKLVDWATDHGINPFVLARHIFTYGTEPTFFLLSSLAEAAL